MQLKSEVPRVILTEKVFCENLEKATKDKIEGLLSKMSETFKITSVSQLYHLLVQFKGECLEALNVKKEEQGTIMNNEDYILKLVDLLGGNYSEFDSLYNKFLEEKKEQREGLDFERILKRFGYEKVRIYEYNENDKREMEEDFLVGKINLEELKLIISFLSSDDFGCLNNSLTYEMSKFFLPILKDKDTLSKLKDVSNNERICFRYFSRFITNQNNEPIQLYNIFKNNITKNIIVYLYSMGVVSI